MPYVVVKKDRDRCNCILPVGPKSERRVKNRPGIGSVWQCPSCGAYWEVVEGDNGEKPPYKWEAIAEERAKLLIGEWKANVKT